MLVDVLKAPKTEGAIIADDCSFRRVEGTYRGFPVSVACVLKRLPGQHEIWISYF
jgi:hypothetical protein